MKANIKNIFLAVAIGGFITVTATSCKKDDPAPSTPNVVQLAQSDTTLSLLVTLVTKAGLAATLSTTNDITVFAPTNAAFRGAGISDAAIGALTNDQAKAGYEAILKYHVVGSKIASSAVPASGAVPTLNTKNLYASKNANGVFVNGKKVTTADLNASNGVVHKINGVLLPPTKSIAQIVIDNPSTFSILLAAVQRAGLDDELLAAGNYTVFAPTDAAFSLTPYTTPALITAAPADAVKTIVQAHVIPTNVFASDLINDAPAPTLNAGQTLTVATTPPSVRITGRAISAASPIVTTTQGSTFDIVATNGVIHIISKVIL
jgi:uncharacterized surface protein with fasciclin (FAS1) repeats